jgi:hypothetical protein
VADREASVLGLSDSSQKLFGLGALSNELAEFGPEQARSSVRTALNILRSVFGTLSNKLTEGKGGSESV